MQEVGDSNSPVPTNTLSRNFANVPQALPFTMMVALNQEVNLSLDYLITIIHTEIVR